MLLSSVETRYEHISLGKGGVPFIVGTTMKVVEIVVGRIAYGWSPEELHFQYPHLSLGQIYSALAYDSDHQEELDRDSERRLEQVDRLERSVVPSRLISRLKSQRKL